MDFPSWISSTFARVDFSCPKCSASLMLDDLRGVKIGYIRAPGGSPKPHLNFDCVCPLCDEPTSFNVREIGIVAFAHAILASEGYSVSKGAKVGPRSSISRIVHPSVRPGCPGWAISQSELQDAAGVLDKVEFRPQAPSWRNFLAALELGPDLPF
jgi:hypothetical protein